MSCQTRSSGTENRGGKPRKRRSTASGHNDDEMWYGKRFSDIRAGVNDDSSDSDGDDPQPSAAAPFSTPLRVTQKKNHPPASKSSSKSSSKPAARKRAASGLQLTKQPGAEINCTFRLRDRAGTVRATELVDQAALKK